MICPTALWHTCSVLYFGVKVEFLHSDSGSIVQGVPKNALGYHYILFSFILYYPIPESAVPENEKVGNQVLCPHSRYFGSDF